MIQYLSNMYRHCDLSYFSSIYSSNNFKFKQKLPNYLAELKFVEKLALRLKIIEQYEYFSYSLKFLYNLSNKKIPLKGSKKFENFIR